MSSDFLPFWHRQRASFRDGILSYLAKALREFVWTERNSEGSDDIPTTSGFTLISRTPQLTTTNKHNISQIKWLRIERKWTQKELAKRPGPHRSNISFLENGLRPTADEIAQITRALGSNDEEVTNPQSGRTFLYGT